MFCGKCPHAIQSEAMIDTKYEEMAEIYNIFCLMNKLKLLCAVFDSHINNFYSVFHTLNYFYMIRQQGGKTVTKYFDCFKPSRVNEELSKGNLTKHE